MTMARERHKNRELFYGVPCACPQESREDILSVAGEVLAIRCRACGRECQSLCPVCGGMFEDAVAHQSRDGGGVCGYFMRLGRVRVPALERNEIAKKKARERQAR